MNNAMTKKDLIDLIAQDADLSKSSASRALDACISAITASLKNGQDVVLTGFGSFSASQRSARTGRNPQTGQPMQIPATMVARFKAGKQLKDAIKERL